MYCIDFYHKMNRRSDEVIKHLSRIFFTTNKNDHGSGRGGCENNLCG